MVGVPGRSKGCHTCKKRKKKCDLERPFCRNCTRGGFVCGGYEKSIVMVHADEQGRGSYHQQLQRTTGKSLRRPALNASLIDIRYKKLNRTASELECFEAFRRGFTPIAQVQGREVHAAQDPSHFGEWWTQTYESASRSELLRSSLLSASGFMVGHFRQDYELRNRGLELYHESIKLMSQALTPSRLARHSTGLFDLLMAGYLLEAFEFIIREIPDITEQSTPSARFRKFYDGGDIRVSVRARGHIQGMMSLVRTVDPKVFSHPALHQMFLQFRQVWICLSLENRRSTFLSSEEWSTKPWTNLRKTFLDTLWDTIVFIPDILEAFDNLSSASPGQDEYNRATLLWNQCLDLETAYDRWRDELSSECPSMTQQESDYLRGCIDAMGPEDLPDRLVELGLWYLLAWMLHWASRIILHGIKPLVRMRCPPETSMDVASEFDSIASYSLGIARATKLLFERSEMEIGLFHHAILRVPVAVVQQLLQNPLMRSTDDPKLNEAEIILRAIGTSELELEVREPTMSAPTPKSFVIEGDDTDSAYSSESAW